MLCQCCNAWHRCIVKDTVKVIHFPSNALQCTLGCPQMLYLVYKILLNMFLTLKKEVNFKFNKKIHPKWEFKKQEL